MSALEGDGMLALMPTFEHDGATIYFEEHGRGFPILLLAPGGMRSGISFWQRTPYNPIKELSSQFRVIACDQRNAGQSDAPISGEDGWHSYAADQLALLDHLGVTRCHLLGGCIGGAFALRLIEAAPQRMAAAVLQQPIGHSPSNREVFYELFDSWAREISPRHHDVPSEAWQSFREHMYG
ncbi:MAG TPA: alpha/beta hydrolase, partial [Polyangiales bacterium]